MALVCSLNHRFKYHVTPMVRMSSRFPNRWAALGLAKAGSPFVLLLPNDSRSNLTAASTAPKPPEDGRRG
jgi:hypothetical protein